MYRRFFEVFGRKKKLVYLHHGTLGFKKFDPFYHENCNIMQIFTVGSTLERDILVDQEGVDEHRVKVTGYARADLLRDSMSMARQILYMPTHRRHLQGQGRKRFTAQLEALLGNPVLGELLDQHDIILKVYLHAHTQKTLTLSLERQPRIELVKVGQESVRQLVSQSLLMITDYSSVCWDFLSLAKPVVFYRFDLDNYAAARDSYVNLKDESFGQIAYKEEQLLELLSQYLDGRRCFDPGILQNSGIVEAVSDDANCERIYRLVVDALGAPAAR
jgi:CDP-glycerol glycerophosphotransferase (TagB/SpsB family)